MLYIYFFSFLFVLSFSSQSKSINFAQFLYLFSFLNSHLLLLCVSPWLIINIFTFCMPFDISQSISKAPGRQPFQLWLGSPSISYPPQSTTRRLLKCFSIMACPFPQCFLPHPCYICF